MYKSKKLHQFSNQKPANPKPRSLFRDEGDGRGPPILNTGYNADEGAGQSSEFHFQEFDSFHDKNNDDDDDIPPLFCDFCKDPYMPGRCIR